MIAKAKLTILASLLSVSVVGCKSTGTPPTSATFDAGTNGGKLVAPPAGTDNNPLDVDAIVKYMLDTKAKFYDGNKPGFDVSDPKYATLPNINDFTGCLGNNPQYWSTLVQHFYCLHPSYNSVIPNIRGCFSRLANGSQVNGRGFYPEVFDYCMYQEYDAVQQKVPTFDKDVIAKNKALPNGAGRVGVMKYMTAEEEEVFKYVLYTWYNPFAFKVEDQQAVLDKFWAVVEPGRKYTVQTTGKSKHPNTPAIVTLFKTMDANNNEIPWENCKFQPNSRTCTFD